MGLPCLPLPGGTDTQVGVDRPCPVPSVALRSGIPRDSRRSPYPIPDIRFYLLTGDTTRPGVAVQCPIRTESSVVTVLVICPVQILRSLPEVIPCHVSLYVIRVSWAGWLRISKARGREAGSRRVRELPRLRESRRSID